MVDSCDTDEVTEPRHVNCEVYRILIQPQLFPLTTFPYSLAVDTIRAYLRAFGTTRYESMPRQRLLGYKSNTDVTLVDKKSKVGLVFIKEQFLLRSELSFEQLLVLLCSLFLKRRTATEMYDGAATFSGRADDMRLRLAYLNGTAGPLDENIWYQLQGFVRLHKELEWAVRDTAVILESVTKEG
ncbi:hypothetical protein ANO14919_041370 [Xylariales sp. No.14919]|nr:hypothetical protein ANO14919_041370 [Xylariales sp. No.14919]